MAGDLFFNKDWYFLLVELISYILTLFRALTSMDLRYVWVILRYKQVEMWHIVTLKIVQCKQVK